MKDKQIYEDSYFNEEECCADPSITLIDGRIICLNCGCIFGKSFVEKPKGFTASALYIAARKTSERKKQ